MLKNFLQGKPFKHPLHPLFVHFPLGLFGLSLLFDLATLGVALSGAPASLGNTFVQGAFYTLLLGEATAFLAAVPGWADWMDIRLDHPGKKIANLHLLLNVFAVGVYGLNLAMRVGGLGAVTTFWGALILSLIGLGVLMISGSLGGRLVYEDGIGVGRHRRRTPLPAETVTISPPAFDSGYARIPGAASLAEGETLRVRVASRVLTLVKHKDYFYAIQEFCPHRFGPLSEGRFYAGQVECPWHRACFDLRTGDVTRGPARQPIQTFEVVADENDVYVRIPEAEAVMEPELV